MSQLRQFDQMSQLRHLKKEFRKSFKKKIQTIVNDEIVENQSLIVTQKLLKRREFVDGRNGKNSFEYSPSREKP